MSLTSTNVKSHGSHNYSAYALKFSSIERSSTHWAELYAINLSGKSHKHIMAPRNQAQMSRARQLRKRKKGYIEVAKSSATRLRARVPLN